jgi:hypothetical protein
LTNWRTASLVDCPSLLLRITIEYSDFGNCNSQHRDSRQCQENPGLHTKRVCFVGWCRSITRESCLPDQRIEPRIAPEWSLLADQTASRLQSSTREIFIQRIWWIDQGPVFAETRKQTECVGPNRNRTRSDALEVGLTRKTHSLTDLQCAEPSCGRLCCARRELP